MATVQALYDVAVERSNLNDSTLIPTDEILLLMSTYEKNVFMTAARENPNYFGYEGTTSARGSSTATWSVTTSPGNVGAISAIEVAAITGTISNISVGTQVNLIDIRSPHHGLSPRVYYRNKTLYEYNSELQADSSNYVTQLKLFYSYLPSTYTAMTTTMAIPDEFASLVYIPMAMALALRDQRPDEVPPLQAELEMHWRIFLTHLGVSDEGTIRELAAIQASSK